MRRIVLILSFLFVLFTGCAQGDPQRYAVQHLSPDTSLIAVDVDINLIKLQNSLNKNINGVIYEDKHMEGDNLMLRLSKINPIRFVLKGNTIEYILPLKVWVKTGFKKNFFGVTLEDYYEAEGSLDLNLSTHLSIAKDWNLLTKTQIKSYRWTEEPQVSIAGVKFPVTTIADIAFDYGRNKINETIDNSIRDNVNLRQNIHDIWNKIQTPMLIDADRQIWLRISPIEIFLSPIISSANTLKLQVGLKSVIESSIGEKPIVPSELTPFRDVQQVSSFSSTCQIFTIADINYIKLEEFARKEMIGKTFTEGKKSVTIKEISIFGNQNKLRVEATVEGAVDGKLIFTGVPVFDNAKKQLIITDFNFDIATNNLLVKGAKWLMHKKLLAMMEPMLTYSFEDDIDSLLLTFNKAMTSYPLSKGVTLQGSIQNCNLEDVFIGEKSVKIGGNISAKLKIQTGDF
ncbi:MAG: DUF4403 family protein [Bacteroidales bacterium]